MEANDDRTRDGCGEPPQSRSIVALQVFLLCEAVALMIALVLPITPSRTGGKSGMAKWFVDDPTYADEVLVGFLMTNGLFLLMAAAALSLARRGSAATDR